MSLPGDLTTIIVTATYESINGAPLSGQVGFSVGAPVMDSTGKVILGIQTQYATLNSAGYMSITLPCTDNAGLSPTGFTYLVTEQVPGLGRSYSVSLPHTLGTTVDLSSLAPVAPVPAPTAFAAANTWTATQTFSASPGIKISSGAAAGDVLTSDASGNATWAAATGGITPPAGDIGGTTTAPTVVSTHLSAALPLAQGGTGQASAAAAFGALSPLTTLGDIIYENATPAAARLAGNTTSTKNFLTQTGTGSVSAAPAWGTIAAADLPAASTSTQGAVILDGTATDIQALGVQAAGSSTKAASATHVHPYQPWQFLPEAYGAAGNGKIVGDISVSLNSPVITSAGLSAPSAPTVNNSGSGGTILAGVYQVKITYVNRYGETVASSASSTTTTGSTSSITITAPAFSGNASGWNAYVTQAGGSTFTLQNSSPLMIGGDGVSGQNLVLTAPPTNTGAQPPASNTTQSNPWTSADINKPIMINGAIGSNNIPLLTTIASFQNSGQVTLAANATVNATGLSGIWGTDDTTAIQSAINAAHDYAVANQYYGEVIFGAKYYIVAGALQTSTYPYYDTQLKFPYPPSNTSRKLVIGLRGAGRNDHFQYWDATEPNILGTVLVSMINVSPGPDANGGYPSVLGAPSSVGGFTGFFVNAKAALENVSIACPAYTNLCAFDFTSLGGLYMDGCSAHIFAQPLHGGGVLLNNLPGDVNFQAKTGTGLRCPGIGNNADIWIPSFTVEGYTTGLLASEHVAIGDLKTIYNDLALYINNDYIATSGIGHGVSILRWTPEAYNGGIKMGGGTCLVNITMYTEDSGSAYDVSDSGNGMRGVIHWCDLVDARSPVVTGAGNVKFYNDKLGPGHWSSAPGVPGSGSAQQNTAWRDASIVLHTGAGVTVSAITVDGTSTGLTMAQNSSLALPVLPAGKNITLTYAGGTPTWDWWLA